MSLIYGTWRMLFSRPKINILVLGLDHSGKSTLLEKIKSIFGAKNRMPLELIQPTVGFNFAKINFEGINLSFWDISGQLKMRGIWERYYNESNVVLFVVDSVDRSRFEEAKLAYRSIIYHNQWNSDTPIIILANKQDIPNSFSISDIAANFDDEISSMPHKPIKVIPISAVTGEGVYDTIMNLVELAKN